MRLTVETRNSIHRKIMHDLPMLNYIPQIHALVQGVVVDNMDPKVRVVYDDPDLRKHLRPTRIEVKKGNRSVPMWAQDETADVVGLTGRLLSLQVDDTSARLDQRRDTLWGKLVNALADSKLVDKYFEQKDLYDTVSNRLKHNLYSVNSVKRLYDVLEPELHQYIPKTVEAALPAVVAPVVGDLRKLGKNLPVVPKAEKK